MTWYKSWIPSEISVQIKHILSHQTRSPWMCSCYNYMTSFSETGLWWKSVVDELQALCGCQWFDKINWIRRIWTGPRWPWPRLNLPTAWYGETGSVQLSTPDCTSSYNSRLHGVQLCSLQPPQPIYIACGFRLQQLRGRIDLTYAKWPLTFRCIHWVVVHEIGYV
jgi:hypothetical protein